MILYPLVALLISFILNLYVTIYSNPHLIYFDLSSDKNLSCRIYYGSKDGYKKQSFRVLKIEENNKFKKYRIAVPYSDINKIKFSNFNKNSKLKIKNNINIYNKNSQFTINKFINYKPSKLVNHDFKEINYTSSNDIIIINTNINLKAFEINFEKPIQTWKFKDFITKNFHITTLKYFCIFLLVFTSINIIKE